MANKLDLWEITARGWHIILASTLVCAAAAGVTSVLLKPTYEATSSLLPRAQNNSLYKQLSRISGSLPIMDLASGEGNELTELLRSRTLLDRVIRRLSIDTDAQHSEITDTIRNRLRSQIQVTPPSGSSSLIIIKSKSDNAEEAARIANAYIDELKLFADEIGFNEAAKNRKFIAQQLELTKTSLTKAENSLTKFQETNHLVSLPEAIKSSISALSQLEAHSVESQLNLALTNESMQSLSSRVSALQIHPGRLVELEVRKKELEAQRTAISRAQSEFTKRLESLPPKAMQLARLQRDVEVQSSLFSVLTQQYQLATLEEARESDSFLVLDRALPSSRPTKPKIPLNIAIGALSGFLFGIALNTGISISSERSVNLSMPPVLPK